MKTFCAAPNVKEFWALPAAILACACLALPARAQAPESKAARTLDLLNKRKREQIETVRNFRAFHAFQFSDGLKESGITFENRIVDDAGKNWKPGHYDHGNGVAVADVDGDGLPDIFFPTQLGSCQLWRNLGEGKFEDITAKAGVGLNDQVAVAASFGDLDNDGDPDLFVTTVRHGNHLFENLGNGRFRDVTQESGLAYSGHSSGAVFFDFDRDGLLDLYLLNVGVFTSDEKGKGGFFLTLPEAFKGHLYPERTETSILYKNLGGLKFKDVSARTKLGYGGWSGDATFCDLDGDGFPDLYVLNMQGKNHFFENKGGQTFEDKTPAYFPKTPWGAMGLKFFDFNNDGLMDLFVTDMHSDMTGAQRQQAGTLRLAPEKMKTEAWCAAEYTEKVLRGASNNIFGNAFYVNKGAGKFEEQSDALGVETYWPWGPSVGDLNADGFEDVFVTAGMNFPFRYAINSVLLNEMGARFFDSEFVLGIEPRPNGVIEKVYFTLDCDGEDRDHRLRAGRSGLVPINGAVGTRGAAMFDLDGDGDLDIVTNEFNEKPQILVSNLAQSRKIRFLKIKLVGKKSNRDGLGATVKLFAGATVQTRYHDGKSGYLSQSSLPLYFGLGEADKLDRIEILWPSGTVQTMRENLAVNRLLVIEETADAAR